MNNSKLPEKCNVANIERWLAQTSVYIRCIPGQEWKLWKVGRHYHLQQVLPAAGKKKMYTNLTELLLWFVIGDAVQKAQYDPLPSGNVLSFERGRKA